jgi:hypothetical protein
MNDNYFISGEYFVSNIMKTKSIFSVLCILGGGVQHHFQQYFSHILAISFIGGGNRRKRRPAESH